MDSASKAYMLYKAARNLQESGDALASENLVKVADYCGRQYVKEALAAAKKLTKQSVIEKPISKSEKHSGLKKKAYRKKEAAKFLQGALSSPYLNNALVKNMGRGAAMTLGGAAVAAPVASYMVNRESDNLMNKVKEYAVPGALAVAGLAAGAYNMMGNPGQNTPRVPHRAKLSTLIQGFKSREKLAQFFGENSPEVRDCEFAISRILFQE